MKNWDAGALKMFELFTDFRPIIITDTNLAWWTGGADVHRGGAAVHRLLVAVPLLLRGRLHRRPSDNLQVRAARLHGLLLAGHVQRHDQPARLLLDERQVRHSIFLQLFSIYLDVN